MAINDDNIFLDLLNGLFQLHCNYLHAYNHQCSGMNISPYCDELDDTTLGCTVNHEYMSTCVHSSQAFPPPEFQVSCHSPSVFLTINFCFC